MFLKLKNVTPLHRDLRYFNQYAIIIVPASISKIDTLYDKS